MHICIYVCVVYIYNIIVYLNYNHYTIIIIMNNNYNY